MTEENEYEGVGAWVKDDATDDEKMLLAAAMLSLAKILAEDDGAS